MFALCMETQSSTHVIFDIFPTRSDAISSLSSLSAISKGKRPSRSRTSALASFSSKTRTTLTNRALFRCTAVWRNVRPWSSFVVRSTPSVMRPSTSTFICRIRREIGRLSLTPAILCQGVSTNSSFPAWCRLNKKFPWLWNSSTRVNWSTQNIFEMYHWFVRFTEAMNPLWACTFKVVAVY